MKRKPPHKIEKYRVKNGHFASNKSFGNNGLFIIPTKKGKMRIIVSDGMDWDHVSVSFENRVPTWKEMCFAKDLFFEKNECVIQYHPPELDYINDCRFCLHLWRPQKEKIPMPPLICV